MKKQMGKEEYEKISEESRIARLILNNADFKFIRDYITNGYVSVEQAILNNTIHDVTERVTLTQSQPNGFPLREKEFFTPKKQQIDELKGQWKWVKQFLADLEYFASQKAALDKEVLAGRVILETDVKKDLNYAGPRTKGKK
jgi:hypothetical protein